MGELFRSERSKADLDLSDLRDWIMYVKGLFVEKPQTAEKAEGGLESLMCDTSSDANQTG
jgi:hypothetical protein